MSAATTECLKIACLRKKKRYRNALEWVLDYENNTWTGRDTKIFIDVPPGETVGHGDYAPGDYDLYKLRIPIDKKTGEPSTKRVLFWFAKSKWHNPYPVGKGKYTLEESLKLYVQHLINSIIISDHGHLYFPGKRFPDESVRWVDKTKSGTQTTYIPGGDA